MKRFVIRLLIILVLIVLVIYIGGGQLLTAAAKKGLPAAERLLRERGTPVADLDFDRIGFTSFNRLSIYGLSGNLVANSAVDPIEALFSVNRVDLTLAQLRPAAVRISLEKFSVIAEQNKQLPSTAIGRVEEGYWSVKKPMVISRLAEEWRRYRLQLQNLFNEEYFDRDMQLRALVTLKLRGKEAQAMLYTVEEEGGARLRLETRDVQKASEIFQQELSPDEIEIISRYPMRAPVIMQLTSEARRTAREAHRANPAVPEDAYRHVLWSYLLTRQFDADFAKKVTDAHEVLPTNTVAERKMDFINNRIGRNYALNGIPRERILSLVMTDPQVIRRPQDAPL
ncbi:MAG: hypothetical protein ONA69_08990 [candidate division KSB1 bacterium]|nr:hypothetical protein [candidate division KSB1 bacterium]MDZ7346911.1 hypothetical protein [candidate division KSB1 bacterium]